MPRTQHENMESENMITTGSTDPGKETLQEAGGEIRGSAEVMSRFSCRDLERAEVEKKRQVFGYKRWNVPAN